MFKTSGAVKNDTLRAILERLVPIVALVLGLLLVANIVVLGDREAAVRMHWDLAPAADDLLVEAKVLVCFATGLLFVVAGYGALRHRRLPALAGVAGAALFLGYYLVEIVIWGGSHPPVWIGLASFGGLSALVGALSWQRWRASSEGL